MENNILFFVFIVPQRIPLKWNDTRKEWATEIFFKWIDHNKCMLLVASCIILCILKLHYLVAKILSFNVWICQFEFPNHLLNPIVKCVQSLLLYGWIVCGFSGSQLQYMLHFVVHILHTLTHKSMKLGY